MHERDLSFSCLDGSYKSSSKGLSGLSPNPKEERWFRNGDILSFF